MTSAYNPISDVTAAQLREAGVPVPMSIPDAWWVSRLAVVFKPSPGVQQPGDVESNILRLNFEVTISEPFHE